MNNPFRFAPDAAIVQCAANFSEGRRGDIIEQIVGERIIGGAVAADVSADCDHNRSVITWLGQPDALRKAVPAAAERATQLLDLRTHSGVHPRLGVVDVVPFTPIRNATMPQCVDLARDVGREFAQRLGIPVYFYEAAALPARPAALPEIRRLARRWPDPEALPPDIVPDHLLPGAGVSVVGARGPLVAFNVMLEQGTLEDARSIAAVIRSVRTNNPKLRGVRALGLYLPTQGQAQVSMNLTRPEETPLATVYDFVAQEACRLGARAGEAEVIGLIPAGSLMGADLERMQLTSLRPEQIVENWIVGDQ